MTKRIITYLFIIFFSYLILTQIHYTFTKIINKKTSITTESNSVKELPKINNKYPPFQLPDINDKKYNVTRIIDNKPIIINFWATWCEPCIDEIPTLNKLYSKYSKKISFFAVTSLKKDSKKNILEFKKKYQFEIPILIDSDNSVFKKYSIRFFPTSFLIDNNGMIVDIINGTISEEEWEKRIKKILE